MRLTDGERDILREIEDAARHTAEALEVCDGFQEIADADMYTPHEWHAFGECFPDADGDEIPF